MIETRKTRRQRIACYCRRIIRLRRMASQLDCINDHVERSKLVQRANYYKALAQQIQHEINLDWHSATRKIDMVDDPIEKRISDLFLSMVRENPNHPYAAE